MFSAFFHFVQNKRFEIRARKRYKQEKPHGEALGSFISPTSHKFFTKHSEIFILYIAIISCFYNIMIWLNIK